MFQIHDLLIKDSSVLQSAYCKYLNEVGAPSVSTELHVLNLRMEKMASGYTVVIDINITSGPGSVVGIATAYGLDGPGIESRWGVIFRTCPDRP